MGSGYSKGVIIQKKIRDERQPRIVKYFTDKLTIKTIAELEKIRNDYKKVYDPLTISPAPLSKIFKKFTDSDIIAVKNIINDGTADINKRMEACARLAADYCVYDIFTKYKNIGSTYYDDIDKTINDATQIKTEMAASDTVAAAAAAALTAGTPPLATGSSFAARAAAYNTDPYKINTVITGINAAAPPATFNSYLIDVELQKMYNKSAFDVVLTNLIAELNRIKNMSGKPTSEEFKQLKRNVLVAENEITRAKVNPIEQFTEKAKHLPWKISEMDALVTKVEKEHKEATKSGGAPGGGAPGGSAPGGGAPGGSAPGGGAPGGGAPGGGAPGGGAPGGSAPGGGAPGATTQKIGKLISSTNFNQFKNNVTFQINKNKNPLLTPLLTNLQTAITAGNQANIIKEFRALIKQNPKFGTWLANGMGPVTAIKGGARVSYRNRRVPERQSYRRPRSRGISTRKNHRPRKGE